MEMKTIMGQTLDLLATNFGKKLNLDLFTMDRYNSIVKYKTAYYTFVLPVTVAMHLVSVTRISLYNIEERLRCALTSLRLHIV